MCDTFLAPNESGILKMTTKIEIELNQYQVAVIESVIANMPEEAAISIKEVCETLLAREIATIDYVEKNDAHWMTTDSIRAMLMQAESAEEVNGANETLFDWAANQADPNPEPLDR
jgi:hypothetical protein